MSKLIHLTNGGYTIVDNQDYEFLSQFRWRKKLSDGSDTKYHAVRDISLVGKRLLVRMHRLITEADKDQLVYHINEDTLDNRRGNLQIRTINPWTGRPNNSGFIGVHQVGHSSWKTEVLFAGNMYQLGIYNDPEVAAKMYDNSVRRLYGINAVTNF
jgi:hypothetical protein